MSNFSAGVTAEDLISYDHACLNMYPFGKLPRCKDSDFLASFKTTMTCSKEATDLITKISMTRTAMSQELSVIPHGSSNLIPIYSSKIEKIDAYLPHIGQLIYSLNNQEAVKIDAVLVFSWLGGIGHHTNESDPSSYFSFRDLAFDVVSALSAKAMFHFRLGLAHISDNAAAGVGKAGQSFAISAGIMQYLLTHSLPAWISLQREPLVSKQQKIPAECRPSVCEALLHLFHSYSAACTAFKAMQPPAAGTSSAGGKSLPPPALLAKLCRAVAVTSASAVAAMTKAIEDGKARKLPPSCLFDPALLTHAKFNRDFYTSLASYYHAEALIATNTVGKAIGFLKVAKSLLSSLQTIAKQSGSGLQHLVGGVTFALERVVVLESNSERENSLIYFQPAPPPTAALLDELPEPVYVVPIKTYEPPPYGALVKFTYPDTDTTPASLTTSTSTNPFAMEEMEKSLQETSSTSSQISLTKSSSASSSNSGTQPTAPPAVPLSDEEFARQLQDRLNRGEEC